MPGRARRGGRVGGNRELRERERETLAESALSVEPRPELKPRVRTLH